MRTGGDHCRSLGLLFSFLPRNLVCPFAVNLSSVFYGCQLSQSTPNEFLPSGLAPRVRMTSLFPVGLMVQPSTSIDHSAGETKAFPYAIGMLLNFAHFSLLKSEFQGSKIFQFPNTGYTGVWDGGKEKTPGVGRWNLHLMKVPWFVPVLTLVKGCILYRLMMGVCEPLEIKFRRMLYVHLFHSEKSHHYFTGRSDISPL